MVSGFFCDIEVILGYHREEEEVYFFQEGLEGFAVNPYDCLIYYVLSVIYCRNIVFSCLWLYVCDLNYFF